MPTSNGSANGAPLSPQTSYSASKSAMAAIFGPDHRYSKGSEQKAQSNAEPPSGIAGKGTVGEPYDQGNAPENIAGAGAGALKGKGGEEPLSGVQGKGTKDVPYDQGNAGETTASSQPINNTTSTTTTASQPPASSPSTTTPANTTKAAATNTATTNGATTSPTTNKTEPTNERGRSLAPPANNASRQERSVSPGTLDDGTHELCAGEKGGSYEPSRGLGRLANKVFGGK